MTDARACLTKFMAEWNDGERPDVEAVLAAAPADHREQLAGAIGAFLFDAPLPRYDEQTLNELESSQQAREAERAIEGRSGTWPLLLPSLRRQRRLSRARVAQGLATELGFSTEHERVHEHLHNMEAGTADAHCVSRRVLAALARVLGTTAADLERAGRVLTLGGPVGRLTPTRRGFPDPPPFSEIPSGYTRPDTSDHPEWAVLDRLFLGSGR